MRRKYNYDNYTCSSNTHLLRKSYGDIDVTVIVEREKVSKEDVRNEAIIALLDELGLLLNDSEFEGLLKSKFNHVIKTDKIAKRRITTKGEPPV